MSDLTLPPAERPTGSLRDQLSKRQRRTKSVFLANRPGDADRLRKARLDLAEAKQRLETAQLGVEIQSRSAGVSTIVEAEAALAAFPKWVHDDLEEGEPADRRDDKMRRIAVEVLIELIEQLAPHEAAVTEAEKAVDAIESSIDVWEFEFTALSQKRMKQLEDAAQPTEEELDQAKAQQRAVAEANKGVPKDRQQKIPPLPAVSLDALADPLIVEACTAVRRWPDGRGGAPIDFDDTLDADLLAAMFDEFGWTASDRNLLFATAYTLDDTPAVVSWEQVGKG